MRPHPCNPCHPWAQPFATQRDTAQFTAHTAPDYRYSAAELHWDCWLGKPYLLLDLYDVRIRYYSTCEDPLHLLRLAKYRMPHLTLRA